MSEQTAVRHRRDAGNIAALHEAIASQTGERDCIVWRDRVLTWDDVTERTRRLAHALLAHGIGGDVDLDVDGWVSPHEHVALFLTNCNEYLETMLGAWKARAAAVNVNYRYTPDELVHILTDSSAVAVVYHARFTPVIAAAVGRCPRVRLLVVVDDGSKAAPVPGSIPYEDFLAAGHDSAVALDWTADDRYIVYTGGTTGRPKGVLWRQGDFLTAALGVRSSGLTIVERARRSGRPRALPAPPFMHGAAHWNAISCWLAGGTVVIQDVTDRFDPTDVLECCSRHRVTSLLVVGDSFARPLARAAITFDGDLSSLEVVMTGGAVLSPAVRRQLTGALGSIRVVDILGSSETGRHGVDDSARPDGGDDEGGIFTPSSTTVVLDETRSRVLSAGEDHDGWLAQRGAVPRGYLGDPKRSATTFPVVDGVAHAVGGDRARLLADGRIKLLGRDSVTINTGGEKVHAEEVEQVLKEHPSVFDVLVVGRPSERWGSEVVAVVSATPGHGIHPAALERTAVEALARYKLPKDYVVVDEIVRLPSGKPDYAWARRVAMQAGSTR